jgi:hypothetical protein
VALDWQSERSQSFETKCVFKKLALTFLMGFVKKSSSLHMDRTGGQWPYSSNSKRAGYISKINMEKRKG